MNPKNIVVVTFTNKAANEMKKRLSYLIGENETKSLMIGTFHAICCRLLRLYAKMVDLDSNFTVADNDLSKTIIGNLRKDPQVRISQFTRSQQKVGNVRVHKIASQRTHLNKKFRCHMGFDQQS